ncbi:uncharacterized protein BDV14DRAFT_199328 [Aspergillus stella-maris]|uniref:uncharacterized protein n=1 Tax=Aspergillus stella-maris TaxID=1810926 RepID=UPI003CCD4093
MCQHIYTRNNFCGHFSTFTLAVCRDLSNIIRTGARLPLKSHLVKRDYSSPGPGDPFCLRCMLRSVSPKQKVRVRDLEFEIVTDEVITNALRHITYKAGGPLGSMLTAEFKIAATSWTNEKPKVIYRLPAGSVMAKGRDSAVPSEVLEALRWTNTVPFEARHDDDVDSSRVKEEMEKEMEDKDLESESETTSYSDSEAEADAWFDADADDDYDMCHVIELTPQMNAAIAASAYSPPDSEYETGDEGDDEDDEYEHLTSSSCLSDSSFLSALESRPLLHSPREKEFWDPGRTGAQSPNPGFNGFDNYFGDAVEHQGYKDELDVDDLDLNELICNSISFGQSHKSGGLFLGIQQYFPGLGQPNRKVAREVC